MNICVFCGSSKLIDRLFLDTAYELGERIAKTGNRLVYGGGDRAMMGRLADGALENGGQVTAVITEDLLKTCGHKEGTKLIVLKSMSARKNRMLKLGDAFIALRGGFGTYDEIFEALTLKQIRKHSKPCAFLNINNSFEFLIRDLDAAVETGHLSQECREMAFFTDSIDALLCHCCEQA